MCNNTAVLYLFITNQYLIQYILHTLQIHTLHIYTHTAGDEGGFAPPIQSNKEGVVLLMEAIEKAGHLNKIILGI